jgi:hypothetical protein
VSIVREGPSVGGRHGVLSGGESNLAVGGIVNRVEALEKRNEYCEEEDR